MWLTSCNIGGQKPPQLGLRWCVAIARPLVPVPVAFRKFQKGWDTVPAAQKPWARFSRCFAAQLGRPDRPSVLASRASAGTVAGGLPAWPGGACSWAAWDLASGALGAVPCLLPACSHTPKPPLVELFFQDKLHFFYAGLALTPGSSWDTGSDPTEKESPRISYPSCFWHQGSTGGRSRHAPDVFAWYLGVRPSLALLFLRLGVSRSRIKCHV